MKIAIIGSGISGLAAACFLAKEGFDVTILEKNESPGGRARKFEAEGFMFDMGPSWYWMPDIFENFFNAFGKKTSDYYELERLDPSYQVFYSKDDVWSIPASVHALGKFMESIEPGSGKKLHRFLAEGKFKYEIGMKRLVYKPGLSVTELIDKELIKGMFRLQVFQSMTAHIKKYFTDPRIIQLLEFPVLFLGAAPKDTPALYSLMNYADISLGTWYPKGGMFKIIEAMVTLAKEQGVNFRFNSTVEKINVINKQASEIIVNGKPEIFDYIVASADYHHIEQQVLPEQHRRYTKAYWQKRVLAPSSVVYYIGVSKKLNRLLHHNLFFDQDFIVHANEIYENPAWPSNPLFYVCCPSKTDNTVAPANSENLFILIPVAPGLTDTEALREKYFDTVMSRLESLTRQSIRESIVYKRSYAHRDFISDYNAFKGNAYGLANTLMQTANLKPSIINPKVKNLFYTGQLTVPGPGMPPALVSGEVVAKELIKRINKG